MSKVIFTTTKKAAEMIQSNSLIGSCGFMLTGAPEEVLMEIGKRYLETQEPRNLSFMWASGIGDGGNVRGLNHICHEGLITKVIGGHFGLIKKMGPMVIENKIQAYNFPQGVMCQMFRDMAAGKPGTITHVGLGTFVDPDYSGGKINQITTEDIVKKIQIEGKDYLFYRSQKLDYAIIRGTEADENGNISLRKEALTLESLSVAMAAKNNGGKVIVQVEKVVKNGTIPPKDVKIPGILVDVVAVVSDVKNHMQTAGTQYNEDFISGAGVFHETTARIPLDEKKIIARRSAMEVTQEHRVLNYGIGVPERVASVLKEESVDHHFVASVEPGLIGGIAQGGLNFGSAIAPQAIIDEPYQFDFYDGGGIDVTFLGMAECDSEGNLNVSKFGVRLAGCGGFIDISQNAKNVMFCGSFTADGLGIEISDGKLKIVNEGKIKKFKKEIEQITFNGEYERRRGSKRKILYVTERAVFQLKPEGLTLIEIAPGIDLQSQVIDLMEFNPLISKDLKLMDSRIFQEELMNLKDYL